MNKKLITLYIVVVYAVSILALALHAYLGTWGGQGTAQREAMLLLGLSVAPAAAALVLSLWFGGSGDYPVIRLWPIPVKPFLAALVGVPAAFALIYGLARAVGWIHIDWSMARLINQLPNYRDMHMSEPLSPGLVFSLGFIASLFLGVTVAALFAVGIEAGWRSFLLQQFLRTYGPVRAYVVTGLLWGIWLIPLAFIEYRSGPWYSLVIRVVLMAVALSIVLGEVWRRHQHVGLNAAWLGLFAAQSGGMWVHLAPKSSGSITGPFGVVSIVVWAAIAAAFIMRSRAATEPQMAQIPQTNAEN